MKERNRAEHEMNGMKGLTAILGATVLEMIALACRNGAELPPTSDGASTPVATSTAAPPTAAAEATAVPSSTPVATSTAEPPPAAAEATAVPSPTPAASSTAPAPAVMGSIAPNQRLTFEGVEYRGVEILGAASPTGRIVCCGTPSDMDDMEIIGTGAEHNPDVYTTVQNYRPKAGGTTDVYTFHPAQTLGITPATWTRWTAASETRTSDVYLTLSAEQAPGQPLTVNLMAEIVGGPDNNRDLYCKCSQWYFGNGMVIALCVACVGWTPDVKVPRRFEYTYTYEMPGTYEIRFSYGPLKSEPISVEVRSEEKGIDNKARGPSSSISGGENNEAIGINASVCGGRLKEANRRYVI